MQIYIYIEKNITINEMQILMSQIKILGISNQILFAFLFFFQVK